MVGEYAHRLVRQFACGDYGYRPNRQFSCRNENRINWFFQHNAASSASGFFGRSGSDGDIVKFYKDGTTVGSIGATSGDLTIDGPSEHTGLRFEATDITPRHNGALSNGVNNIGSSSYRFKDLYLSGGVYLGGTVAANLLDDYEEGTWIPVLASDASVSSYTTQVGKYTKIGNVVTANFNVQMAAVGSFAGAIINITGLPFNSASNACDEIGTVNVRDPASAFGGNVYLRLVSGDSYVRLEQYSGTTTADHNSPANKIDTGTLLQGSITYLTA